MASLWTKKFSGAWVVAGILTFYAWKECRPLPWAVEMTRGTVEACYAEFVSGFQGECHSDVDFQRANEAYGPLKSYRIASIDRGFRNDRYTVTVDAERERGSTREVAHVFTAYLQRRDEKVSSINALEVELR